MWFETEVAGFLCVEKQVHTVPVLVHVGKLSLFVFPKFAGKMYKKNVPRTILVARVRRHGVQEVFEAVRRKQYCFYIGKITLGLLLHVRKQ